MPDPYMMYGVVVKYSEAAELMLVNPIDEPGRAAPNYDIYLNMASARRVCYANGDVEWLNHVEWLNQTPSIDELGRVPESGDLVVFRMTGDLRIEGWTYMCIFAAEQMRAVFSRRLEWEAITAEAEAYEQTLQDERNEQQEAWAAEEEIFNDYSPWGNSRYGN